MTQANRQSRPRAKAKAARSRPSPRLRKTTSAIPAIGTEWHGGIYAGIARGRDSAPDYHLIVGAEVDCPMTWDEAMQQGLLPYRKEQALCFANVPELFKPEAYWSCEQHASCSDFAWGQHFVNGGQGGWGKNGKLRARLVRRLPL